MAEAEVQMADATDPVAVDEVAVAVTEVADAKQDTLNATTEEMPTADTAKLGEEAKQDTAMIKTTAKIDDDFSKNVKFDASVLPDTDDPIKIRTQVEFYFSDSNLPHDKYLWQLTGGTENKPVKIEDVCKFSRMRRFQPYSAVVAALRDSELMIVTGEEGQELIQRKIAYQSSNRRRQVEEASVYAKGFGDETASTQFDLEAFFTQFGPINAVRLRRTPEKLFKGSVFVEFQNAAAAQEFLKLDPKPQWKDHDLKIMSKTAYVKEKSALINEGKIEPSKSKRKFFEGKEPGDSNSMSDWKQRREFDNKSGFRGSRGNSRGGSRGGSRGRGGRGGGRSFRGGGRGGRSNDRNDRNGHRNNNDTSAPVEIKEPRHATQPRINLSEPAPVDDNWNANGKRAREADATGEPAAKKVDVKPQE